MLTCMPTRSCDVSAPSFPGNHRLVGGDWPGADAGVESATSQVGSSSVTDTLLQRVASGDESAVQAVLDTYGGLVWSLARRFSPSAADAEDAVQEIFLDIWKSAERFNPEVAGEATFVSMISRRRLIDRNRRFKREPSTDPILESDAPSGLTPGDRSELSEEAAKAAAALEELSEDQRRVLRLSIYHGLSHEKIAAAIDMPLGTVKTHARRGLIRVREILKASNVEVGS